MVESRRGAVAWAMRLRPVSPPRSSNRTCRFPASGFPAGFTSMLSAVGLTIQDQAMDAQFPEDRFMAEASSASRWHFVPPCKKAPHVLYDVSVERTMRLPAGSVAEVAVPAAQDRVQPVPDVRPGPAMGRFEMSRARCCLSRATLFGDGLAPRYNLPSRQCRCGPKL